MIKSINELDQRIRITQVVEGTDEAGGATSTSPFNEIWAKVENLGGGMAIDGYQRRFNYSYRITVRHNDKTHEGDLITILSTNTQLEVKQVTTQEIARQLYLEMGCEARKFVVNQF